MEGLREGRRIQTAAVKAVEPEMLIRQSVAVVADEADGRRLVVPSRNSTLALSTERLIVIGFGKAAYRMTTELISLARQWSIRGAVIMPASQIVVDNELPDTIQIFRASPQNLPDESAANATSYIESLIKRAGPEDAVVVLISGGGSALLCSPPNMVPVKYHLAQRLFGNGASIHEVNAVRSRLSTVKRGGLARLAMAQGVARLSSLVLSDVIGDSLKTIACGPTCLDPYSADEPDPLEVLSKFHLTDEVPLWVKQMLVSQESRITEVRTSVPVKNYIIGSNSIALEAARQEALRLGYQVKLLGRPVQEQVEELAEEYASEAVIMATELNKNHRGRLCLLAGGEPTVVVRGPGQGGRSMELALRFSIAVSKYTKQLQNYDVVLLATGTDGQDGPTPAAGALGSNQVIDQIRAKNLDPEEALAISDSYGILEAGAPEALIVTGTTGTNVMDIHALLVQRRHI